MEVVNDTGEGGRCWREDILKKGHEFGDRSVGGGKFFRG